MLVLYVSEGSKKLPVGRDGAHDGAHGWCRFAHTSSLKMNDDEWSL